MDYQRVIDRVDETIVERPGRIVLGFLVVTALFTLGLSSIGTSAGTQQFTSDLPAANAFEAIQDDFTDPFEPQSGSTQLIQEDTNVLSKPALLGMLRTQEALADRNGLRVESSSSAAGIVAQQLDPTAQTTEDQIEAVEDATPDQIETAVAQAAETNPQFSTLVSSDFNRRSASATATIGLVQHDIPSGISSSAGEGGESPMTPIQQRSVYVVENSGHGDGITVFGNGILSQEFSTVITDSLLIVVPAAVIFITLFLVIAYRDLLDLLLGIVALGMAIVWTFGFMGLAGIAFSQMLIAVPPLLLAVGIDFGIHAINRYREERVQDKGIDESMRITTDQLTVAFFIVTGTTVIGFAANLTSDLGPIQDFGLVASIGIVFTFLIFGIFLPAAKVYLDRFRERYPVVSMRQTPLGSEGSAFSRVLRVGVVIADNAPVIFLLVVLVFTAGAGYYATGVSTSFEQEDFLPPEDNPEWIMELPEPFRPNEYAITELTNFLSEKFESTQSDSATVYLEAPMERDTALEDIHRASEDPPDTFLTEDGQAKSTSILTVIQDQAERDEEFAAMVARNDMDDDGVPDQNIDEIYDELMASPAGDQASQYLTDDRRNARVVYTVEADASQDEVTDDTRELADRYRYTAIATGEIVVFQAVANVIFESAVESLALALAGATVFLLFIYRVLEGRASLGVANVVPIVVAVSLLAGTMRLLSIPFNALTATMLAITIGLGIDYSVHVTHRFADERRERALLPALDRTVRGTGGALLGSMLTTVFGIGVLALALFPAIGQFGILTALSIVYSFLASLVVLPSALVIWDRFYGEAFTEGSPDIGPEPATAVPRDLTDPEGED
jgi:predicted RND superfamily exporter protein